MKQPALLLPIALALGAATVPERGAQAEPTAITVCQAISQPGSYKLVNNLTGPSVGVCLFIATDFVTIDLAGLTINGGPGATGILAGKSAGIAVRNGSISGFFSGVLLGGSGSIIEGLRVVGFGDGIDAHGIVRGNTVLDVRDTGIIATGTVTGNDVSNTGVGFHIGQGSTVIGNTATDNAQIGIQADCPSNLTDNTAVNNGTNLVLNGDDCHNEDNVAP